MPPADDAAPIGALVFDLGGVIVPHDDAALRRRIAASCQAGCESGDVAALIGRTDWNTGATPVARLHEMVREELGYRRDWDGFVEDWSSHLGVDFDMLGFVEALAGRHRVLIFSNTTHEHWAFLVAATNGRLARLETYLSCDLGLVKPSREGFDRVAELAGVDPAHALFIDDLAVNVEGARAAGWQAEVFQGQAALAALLRARGVEPPA
jgi:FMN phosphatase YigB (HAD superfamily)